MSQACAFEAEVQQKGVYLKWKQEGEMILIKSVKNLEPSYPSKKGDLVTEVKDGHFLDQRVRQGDRYYYKLCTLENNQCKNAKTLSIKMTKMPYFNDADDMLIYKFAEKGIIKGYENGKFMPDEVINRAEMAKIISLLQGDEIHEYNTEIFCDVSKDDWYYQYVMNLYFLNIDDGFIGGDCEIVRSFLPSKSVNTNELGQIIEQISDQKIVLPKDKPVTRRQFLKVLDSIE
ncbi:MAG: S-layer homology domain-containing protein [Candidatus Gracilibacteria bacterium]|nr:S-layer homology domain-containing protein [Candidatus Gracilibacteria bacterium]